MELGRAFQMHRHSNTKRDSALLAALFNIESANTAPLENIVGGWVDSGLLPDDEEMLADLVRGVCYDNAKKYFKF